MNEPMNVEAKNQKDPPEANSAIWSDLVEWIQSNGGHVHPSLFLKSITDDNRGIFAQSAISSGDLLIRLPRSLALDGSKLPVTYPAADYDAKDDNPETKNASSWLRCIASYFQAQSTGSSPAYFASLPSLYETVHQWTATERDSFLAGTQLGSAWRDDAASAVPTRYLTQVRPYLVHGHFLDELSSANDSNNNKDHEMDQFLQASHCLSTRGFHLSTMANDDTTTTTTQAAATTATGASYVGPFLLPLIDLLNHSFHTATSLQGTATAFVMHAERDIVAGEEICHSYGSELTSSQFLQTFGFVPQERMQFVVDQTTTNRPSEHFSETVVAAASAGTDVSARKRLRLLTPSMLSQEEVLEACWTVIESGLPERLKQAMEEAEMEDEAWNVRMDRTRNGRGFLPDQMVIGFANDVVDDHDGRDEEEESNGILTDELVTLACLPFLPSCAYREAAHALLGQEMLQDYFLGNLVCKSILTAIRTKLDAFTPVPEQSQGDREILARLIQGGDDFFARPLSEKRLAYGLTLRLEETLSLQALQREVLDVLAELEGELEMDESSKRQKTD